MQQLFNFFIRNKTFLLYLLLFTIALFFTIQSHSYHKSKFINSANFLSGGIYESATGIDQYFRLKEENAILLEENNRLKALLYNKQSDQPIDSSLLTGNFKLTPAQVNKNSYAVTNNYITINKGTNDSVFQDFGVITSKGIVGIIDNTSGNYSRVMSILNSNSRINARIKNSDHFGILEWNGKSPHVVQLKDVQGLATVNVGDTIVTSGFSATFPKGILIGTVDTYELSQTEDVYTIEVKLANDMTNLGHVYIIENKDKEEVEALENPDNE